MRPTRPTLRCLRDDLHVPLPPVSQPLDEIDHPLLRKAAEQFTDPDIPHERVAALDDQVLFKVKIRRWRGAVWVEPDQPWLVAAGRREDGSPDDFYAALAADARAARTRYNAAHPAPLTTRTHTAHLLPAARGISPARDCRPRLCSQASSPPGARRERVERGEHGGGLPHPVTGEPGELGEDARFDKWCHGTPRVLRRDVEFGGHRTRIDNRLPQENIGKPPGAGVPPNSNRLPAPTQAAQLVGKPAPVRDGGEGRMHHPLHNGRQIPHTVGVHVRKPRGTPEGSACLAA